MAIPPSPANTALGARTGVIPFEDPLALWRQVKTKQGFAQQNPIARARHGPLADPVEWGEWDEPVHCGDDSPRPVEARGQTAGRHKTPFDLGERILTWRGPREGCSPPIRRQNGEGAQHQFDPRMLGACGFWPEAQDVDQTKGLGSGAKIGQGHLGQRVKRAAVT